MKPKTFYTLICANSTAALLKDNGMIPFLMYKNYDFESYFVSYIPEGTEDDCTKQVSGLKMVAVEDHRKDKGKIPMFESSFIKYIFKNAKKMDVLNLYFLKFSILYGILYKILNPNGILYVKLDLNPERMGNEKIRKVRNWVFKHYINCVSDFVSAESTKAYNYVKDEIKCNNDKLLHLYNGLNYNIITKNNIKIKKYDEKDNLIIVVGRIGSPEKNHELLLRALPKIEWKNWEICFIGPIENDFAPEIDVLYSQYPNLKNNVHFVGPIFNKIELFDYYNRAKIFCLSSLWEGFSLVLPEAVCFGNYIVSTPVPPIDDFIQNETLGATIDYNDENIAANVINSLLKDETPMKNAYPLIIEHSLEFHWDRIIQKLYSKILTCSHE